MVRPKQTLNRRRRREIPLLRGKARKTISRRQKRVTSRNPMKKRTHRIYRGGSTKIPEIPAPTLAATPAASAVPTASAVALGNRLPRTAPKKNKYEALEALKNYSKSIAAYERRITKLTISNNLLVIENADLKQKSRDLEDAYLKIEGELDDADKTIIKKNFMISRLAQQKMFFAQALNKALNETSDTDGDPPYTVKKLYHLLSLTESELQNIPGDTESALERLQTHQAKLRITDQRSCKQAEKEEIDRQHGCCGWFTHGTHNVFQRIYNTLCIGNADTEDEEEEGLLTDP